MEVLRLQGSSATLDHVRQEWKRIKAAEFAVNRRIRVHLKPANGNLDKVVFEILLKIDAIFSDEICIDMNKHLMCKTCLVKGRPGYFDLEANMQLETPTSRCSMDHMLEKEFVEMMKDSFKMKPFKLESLMKMDEKSLKLEVFENSKIRTSMLQGKLPLGEQIWIRHTRDTDPNNPIARMNPYAHVVVYVGSRWLEGREVHEVVHVDEDYRSAFAMAYIARVDVDKVIKLDNTVFLGHKLQTCQFAGNLRDKIAERALACVDPKKKDIVFDYNHR
jgi:hypothetical protein